MFRSVRSLFVALMLAALVLPGCAYLTEPWITPGITLVGIRPVELTADRQRFLVRLNVNNPNDRTLPISGVTYSLRLEDREVAAGRGDLDRQIPAFGEGVVDVQVDADLMGLLNDFPLAAFADGRWRYEISGLLRLAGGYVPVPFSHGGQIEAAQVLGFLSP